MTEPEVSLTIAMYYIRNGETSNNVTVSIDGAHVRTKDVIHFDIVEFLKEKGYLKCDGNDRWQGEYKNENYEPHIIITSKPGVGDVSVYLNNGDILYIECKKFKSGSGGEYPAMREAIGQLMTGCPDDRIPVVAVPCNEKSAELAARWFENERMRRSGICFALVRENGYVEFMGRKHNG